MMFLAHDTDTNEYWVVDNGKAKKIQQVENLKWVGPVRKSGSMRYLVRKLYEEIP